MNLVFFRTPTEVPSLPSEVAAPPAEASLPPPKRRQRNSIPVIALAAGLIMAALLIWRLVERHANPVPGGARATALVVRGNFVRSLRLTGTVAAVDAYTIVGPQISGSDFGQLVVTRLAAAGAHVKKGDLLAEFDRQSQIQAFLEAKASYQDLADQVTKSEAAELAARAKDDTDLKQAEDSLKQAQLETLKDPILAAVDVEKNGLNLEEAKAKLKQLRFTYALKRQAAQASIRDLQIQADAKLLAMQYAQQNEKKMLIHSPVDGIVVLDPIWKGNGMGQVDVGDQVWNGEPFLQVVNPRVMEVQIQVNEEDLPYLRVGQAAEIHLDAYPRVGFPGSIEKISPIGIASTLSDNIRTFAAVASIQGSDPRLMPDLSAAVDVQLENIRAALMVPRDAISSKDGRDYVMVQDGLGFRPQSVTVGPMNDTQAVIGSGVRAGNVVERNVMDESGSR
jgi:HlyD family secretion protein